MTPDLWQAVWTNDTGRPLDPPDAGYFPIGPWEPVTSFWGDDCPVVFWRRPLRKVNTGLDSPDVLR